MWCVFSETDSVIITWKSLCESPLNSISHVLWRPPGKPVPQKPSNKTFLKALASCNARLIATFFPGIRPTSCSLSSSSSGAAVLSTYEVICMRKTGNSGHVSRCFVWEPAQVAACRFLPHFHHYAKSTKSRLIILKSWRGWCGGWVVCVWGGGGAGIACRTHTHTHTHTFILATIPLRYCIVNSFTALF